VSARPGRMQRVLGLGFLAIGLLTLAASWYFGREVSRVLDWKPEIAAAAAEHGIDPALLAGLVYAESRGREDAVSSIGALGLCQLIPTTAAEEAGLQGIAGPPYSPEDNLRLGAGYLARMFKRWDGDEDLAVLSYRLGPTGVARRMEEAGGREAWLQAIQDDQPSPWSYRAQIARMQEHYRDEFETEPQD
jgi:soluble lytic murein transglycosylase